MAAARTAGEKHSLAASDLFPMPSEKRAKVSKPPSAPSKLVAMQAAVAAEFYDAVECQMASAHFFVRLPCGHGFSEATLYQLLEGAALQPADSESDDTDFSTEFCAKCPTCKQPFSRMCVRGSVGPFRPASRVDSKIIRALREADDGTDTTLWCSHDSDEACLATVRACLKTIAKGGAGEAVRSCYYTLAHNPEVLRLSRYWQPAVWLYKQNHIFKSCTPILFRAFALYVHGYHNNVTSSCPTTPMTLCLCGCSLKFIMSEILARVNKNEGLMQLESWVLGMVHAEEIDRHNLAPTECMAKTQEKIVARYFQQAIDAQGRYPYPFFDEHHVRGMHADGTIKAGTANRMLQYTLKYCAKRAESTVVDDAFWV